MDPALSDPQFRIGNYLASVDAMLAHCQAFLDLIAAFVHEDYKRQG